MNRKKMNTKTKVIMAHIKLVRMGHLESARRVLHLINNRRVVLGLNDVDWTASIVLEKFGMIPSVSTRSGAVTFTY